MVQKVYLISLEATVVVFFIVVVVVNVVALALLLWSINVHRRL